MKAKNILLILLITLFISLPNPYSHTQASFKGDGLLNVYNVHLCEGVQAQYRSKTGKYLQPAIENIEHTLRCRKTQEMHAMSVKLLELVDQIQDHFGVDHIEVISGYRSPLFNEELISTGHKVAKGSLHTLGLAMDIRVPGVPIKDVRDYVLGLQKGGVGFYPHNDFVHVDVGRVRFW